MKHKYKLGDILKPKKLNKFRELVIEIIDDDVYLLRLIENERDYKHLKTVHTGLYLDKWYNFERNIFNK